MLHQLTIFLTFIMAWAGPIATSPFLIINIAGYAMLLLSPYTRHLASAPVTALCKAISRLHAGVFTYAEMAYQLVLVKEKDDRISRLEAELSRSEASRKSGGKEISTLNALLLESRAASDRLKYPHLHRLTSSKDGEIAHLNTTIAGPETDLKGTRAQANYADARVLGLRGRLSDTKAENRKEVEGLKTSALAREAELGAAVGLLGKYQAAMEVLFALGCGSGDGLVVAVAFARAMKGWGVDEQRVDLLWEFVVGGQRVDAAVQPQGAVKGFRLGQK